MYPPPLSSPHPSRISFSYMLNWLFLMLWAPQFWKKLYYPTKRLFHSEFSILDKMHSLSPSNRIQDSGFIIYIRVQSFYCVFWILIHVQWHVSTVWCHTDSFTALKSISFHLLYLSTPPIWPPWIFSQFTLSIFSEYYYPLNPLVCRFRLLLLLSNMYLNLLHVFSWLEASISFITEF